MHGGPWATAQFASSPLNPAPQRGAAVVIQRVEEMSAVRHGRPQ